MIPPNSISAARLRLLSGWLLVVVIAVGPVGALDRSRLAGGGKDDFLTGDWGGRRTAWLARGINFGLTYTLAGYENTAGGMARGGSVEGTTDLNVALDLEKLVGWRETGFHVSAAAGHGTSISGKFIGDVSSVSSYYIPRGVYLHEVWLQQRWLDQKLTVRVGKLSADLEYPIYNFSDAIPVPLYPTGRLGIRVSYELNSTLFFSAAVYDGQPNNSAHSNDGRGKQGLLLDRAESATSVAMIEINHGSGENALLPSGAWKLGAYHSTRTYPDKAGGVSHRGNRALFLNGDQTLLLENPKVKGDAQGLAITVIGEWAQPDRNSYHYGFGGGIYYTGLIPGRDIDIASLNFLYSRFGEPFSRASVAMGGAQYSFENRWQLYYQLVITKYFSVMPEINYIVRPGGAVTAPSATTFGLRISVSL